MTDTTDTTDVSGAAAAAARPLRKDAVRNRELLIRAALEVFAEQGLEATLDDIARHAGLGVGTAYRHFANKYELMAALVDLHIEEFVASTERALQIADPWQGLTMFLEEALGGQVNNRGMRQVLMGINDQHKLDQVHERLSDRITMLIGELLDRARQAGAVRPEVEATDIGFLIAMLCTISDIAGDTEPNLWRRYLAISLEGLRPNPQPLPVGAMTEPDFRKVMANHKRSMNRCN